MFMVSGHSFHLKEEHYVTAIELKLKAVQIANRIINVRPFFLHIFLFLCVSLCVGFENGVFATMDSATCCVAVSPVTLYSSR